MAHVDHSLGQALTATGILIEHRLSPARAFAIVADEVAALAPLAREVGAGAHPCPALRRHCAPMDHACSTAIGASEIAAQFGSSPSMVDLGWLLQHLGWYVGVESLFAEATRRAPLDQRLVGARSLSMLGVMVGAGEPLISAIDVCSATPTLTEIAPSIHALRAGVERGMYLGMCMREHPALFPADLSEGVLLGELSGRLDAVLVDVVNDIASELCAPLGAACPRRMKEEASLLASSAARSALAHTLEQVAPLRESTLEMIGALRAASLVAALRAFEGH